MNNCMTLSCGWNNKGKCDCPSCVEDMTFKSDKVKSITNEELCDCSSKKLIIAAHRGDHKIIITQCKKCLSVRTYRLVEDDENTGEKP